MVEERLRFWCICFASEDMKGETEVAGQLTRKMEGICSSHDKRVYKKGRIIFAQRVVAEHDDLNFYFI